MTQRDVTSKRYGDRAVRYEPNENSMTLEAVPESATELRPPAWAGFDRQEDTAVPEVDEALRLLLSRRDFRNGQPLPPSIGVVSPSGGEGVSTVANALVNLLRADYDARACLLDFSEPEAETPSDAAPGLLAEIASGRMPIDRIEALDLERLEFGRLTVAQWHALAHSAAFAQALAALRRNYDYLVFDVPPVLSSSRSMVVLRRVDAYVLVARHGVTSVTDVEATTAALAGLESFGSVLNWHRSRVPRKLARWFSTD